MNYLNNKKFFKFDEINDMFVHDAELFINNNVPVRRHFRISIHSLISNNPETFDYIDESTQKGIKLIITDDEDINNLIKYNAMTELYKNYIIPKKLQKKYYKTTIINHW